MRLNQAILITAVACLCNTNLVFAAVAPVAPPAETAAEQASRKALKTKLFNDLSNGSITDATFDQQTETDIANLEMKLANAYLKQGDRKNAIIHAILARKVLQRVLGNPYDSKMIPCYSLLVQLYDSSFDKDDPTIDAADAKKAKLYREAIDHIHAL